MESLKAKTLVMIVGPTAIGKSTLMNETVAHDDEFSYVRSFTTRRKRPDEVSHYDFISRNEFEDLRQNGQTITYFEHPTTHDVYGTTAASFPNRYNLLDTLSGSVQSYRDLPFKDTVTVSLTAPIDQWQEWFLGRYPEPNEEAKKRLGEAVLSINWSLSDKQASWLNNPKGQVAMTAAKLIDTVIDRPETPQPPEPHAMLELIERGVWLKN